MREGASRSARGGTLRERTCSVRGRGRGPGVPESGESRAPLAGRCVSHPLCIDRIEARGGKNRRSLLFCSTRELCSFAGSTQCVWHRFASVRLARLLLRARAGYCTGVHPLPYVTIQFRLRIRRLSFTVPGKALAYPLLRSPPALPLQGNVGDLRPSWALCIRSFEGVRRRVKPGGSPPGV